VQGSGGRALARGLPAGPVASKAGGGLTPHASSEIVPLLAAAASSSNLAWMRSLARALASPVIRLPTATCRTDAAGRHSGCTRPPGCRQIWADRRRGRLKPPNQPPCHRAAARAVAGANAGRRRETQPPANSAPAGRASGAAQWPRSQPGIPWDQNRDLWDLGNRELVKTVGQRRRWRLPGWVSNLLAQLTNHPRASIN